MLSEQPIEGIASGNEEFSYSASRARKGQRSLLNMGARASLNHGGRAPIPLHYVIVG